MVDARGQKFRQAAVVYLHVGLLYLFSVWSMARAGVLPSERGPVGLWLGLGVAVLALVTWGLWSWRNPWFARAIWALHALRLPALLQGAFFPMEQASLPTSFYLTALLVVLGNLWMLARAGWDL
jgi:hypothetical protein